MRKIWFLKVKLPAQMPVVRRRCWWAAGKAKTVKPSGRAVSSQEESLASSGISILQKDFYTPNVHAVPLRLTNFCNRVRGNARAITQQPAIEGRFCQIRSRVPVRRGREVRGGGTPSPALGTSALPGTHGARTPSLRFVRQRAHEDQPGAPIVGALVSTLAISVMEFLAAIPRSAKSGCGLVVRVVFSVERVWRRVFGGIAARDSAPTR